MKNGAKNGNHYASVKKTNGMIKGYRRGYVGVLISKAPSPNKTPAATTIDILTLTPGKECRNVRNSFICELILTDARSGANSGWNISQNISLETLLPKSVYWK